MYVDSWEETFRGSQTTWTTEECKQSLYAHSEK